MVQPPNVRTNDATPTDFRLEMTPQPDSIMRIQFHVFASDHGLGSAYWGGVFGLVNRANGTRALVGAFDTHRNSPSAATWTATLALGADLEPHFLVTGAAGVTVDWLCTNDEPLTMLGALP